MIHKFTDAELAAHDAALLAAQPDRVALEGATIKTERAGSVADGNSNTPRGVVVESGVQPDAGEVDAEFESRPGPLAAHPATAIDRETLAQAIHEWGTPNNKKHPAPNRLDYELADALLASGVLGNTEGNKP